MLAFKEDEKILCFHGPLIYEAKVLKAENWEEKDSETGETGPHYYVHYKGWKQSWDEWVPESRALKFNEANLSRQQQLRELHLQKKKPTKTTGSPADRHESERGSRKRARDHSIDKEEDYMKRPEIKIPVPDALKAQLVDDWENVTKNQQLVPLPRSPTVVQLLDQYKTSKTDKKGDGRTEEILTEVVKGIKLYFDKALGNMLLYRFERNQYVEIRKKYAGKEMSEIYGAEHLLRLFVQMPSLIAQTNMEQDTIALLRDHLSEFMKFLLKHQKQFFLSEYENATPGYVSQTKSN
ncbi:hypothetical protein BZG36_02180 [Bifiguratus adelaidae]|uniref:Chromatin modification-related protein EAF3 n=1 Tax=Bifiguratus adelaidae TaxID=1938954 RepID=A0A261Y0T2_9FUNG|nr:hypothetical protein BZG36_02180 [Bifiguratus adelaidae]